MGAIRELITKWKIETQAQDLEKTEVFLDSLIKKADALTGSGLRLKLEVNQKDADVLKEFFLPAIKNLSALEKKYESFISKTSEIEKSDEKPGKKQSEYTIKLPSPKKIEKFEKQFVKLAPVLKKADKALGGFETKLTSVTEKAGKANLFGELNSSAKKLNKALTKTDKGLTRLGKNKSLGRLNKQLKSSGDDAGMLMSKLQSGFSSFENLLTVGIAGTGAGLLALSKNVSSAASNLDKDSKRLGLGPEMIQGLTYSADLVGTQKDRLMDALKDFGERTQDANLLGGGEAVEAFKIMGMNIKDANGNLKTNTQLLSESADWFAQNTDERKKILVADKLFADAGYDMIPMLNQGSEALRDQAKEARDLGLILSQDTIKSSVKFEKSLTRLWSFIRGLSLQIGSKMIPILDKLTQGWSAYASKNKDVISDGLFTWLKVGVGIIESLSSALKWGIEKTQELSNALGGAENTSTIMVTTLGLLTAAFLAVNAQILLIPALIVGAGILIAMMIQDIMTWAKGGESFFGDILSSAKDFFKSMENNPIGRIVKKIYDIFRLYFTDLLPALFKKGSEFIDPFLNGLESVWDLISNIFGSFTDSTIGKAILSGLESFLSGVESGIQQAAIGLQDKKLRLPAGAEHSSVATESPEFFNKKLTDGLRFTETSRPSVITNHTPSFHITYAPQKNITVPQNMSVEEFSNREKGVDVADLEKSLSDLIRRDSPGRRIR